MLNILIIIFFIINLFIVEIPDIRVIYYMKKHHITINQVLGCHSIGNNSCQSLDKWPKFKKILEDDKD